MRDVLKSFYRPTDQEMAELWEKCIFVLDTNVLLNLYRYKAEARQHLLEVVETIKDRLWIPHQVALEFQRRRLDVIAVEKSTFVDGASKIRDAARSSRQVFHDQSRIPLLTDAISQLLIEVEEKSEAIAKALEEQSSEQPDIHDHDEIRDLLTILLTGKSGPAPTKEFLESAFKAGAERYLNKQPPGLKDAHKEETYTHGGLLYHAKYGDLLVWLQMLDHAKATKVKHLIFITDDKKDDWWHLAKGKTLGPRTELVEEAMRVAGIDLFYMYQSDQFLQLAGQYLRAQVTPNTIKVVKDADRSPISDPEPTLNAKYRPGEKPAHIEAVETWLSGGFGVVEHAKPPFDFHVGTKNGGTESYVKVNVYRPTDDFIEDMLFSAAREILEAGDQPIPNPISIWIIPQELRNERIERAFKSFGDTFPGISTITGTVSASSGRYVFHAD